LQCCGERFDLNHQMVDILAHRRYLDDVLLAHRLLAGRGLDQLAVLGDQPRELHVGLDVGALQERPLIRALIRNILLHRDGGVEVVDQHGRLGRQGWVRLRAAGQGGGG